MVESKKAISIILVFIVLHCDESSALKDNEGKIHQSQIGDSNEDDPTLYRLPENVLPEKYELWLFPQLAIDNFTYEGRVEIQLRVFSETNSLIVNVVGLEIDHDESKVRDIGNKSIPIVKQELDTKRQMYILSFANNISPGRYELTLSFIGKVLDDLNGFYRSSYVSAGKRRWLGVTQFSSIFARRAFPCFDEPYMKAPYRLHIGHYANETVTGNTKAERVREIKPGYLLTTLEETPPMSTYLVGWAIHDFKYTAAPNMTGFGFWIQSSMTNRSSIFLEECVKIYDVLDKWIRVKNPITKMDHMAVPDFFWTAMENWGMITFRENSILWEENTSPTLKLHKGLNTIAHEYAHTWFGNMVTPKFWDVAWLKEGFATFFGHYAVGLVHDEWSVMDMFGIEVLQEALLQDSFEHNRTMNGKNVGMPESIPAAMDFVTYKKGSSIIRMIYYLIGDQAFHSGLQSYVKNLAGKYSTPAVFYQHLKPFIDKKDLPDETVELGDVVETYANQPGYPVITVTRNPTTNVTRITQEKFSSNRSRENNHSDNPRWWIPINFATVETGTRNASRKPSKWIGPHEKSIIVSTIQSTQPILCNVHQAYYYRVNYDLDNWHELISHLNSIKFKNIGSVDRASLIDDSFNLARAGYVDYSIPLELSRYLVQEVDYEPWVAATRSFDFLDIMLSSLPKLKEAFQFHVNRIIQPIYESLTFNQKRTNQMRTKLLQNRILSTACSMNNPDCLNSARSLFKEWLKNQRKRINPDAKTAVYCAGIRSAGSKEWHEVLRIFLATEMQTEQELLVSGLGCTNNATLIKEILNYSLYDGPEVRKQHRQTLFGAVLNGDPKNVEHVLTFVKENLKNILAKRDSTFLNNIFEAVKKRVVDDEQLRMLIDLVEGNANLINSSMEEARKAIKFAEDNISWIKTYTPQIATWLL